jgi:hypothetical protein
MGGMGSGNRYGWNKKTTTEEVKRIDVRFMRKQGLLKPNTQGSLNWTCAGRPSGDIRYSCYQHALHLHYRYRQSGEDWQPVEQQISIERTPCHYGGDRPWFRCPNCHRRVAILYSAGRLFLCRHCYQLPYESQQVDKISRLIAQKHKLGERIFERYEYGEGWGKKKGMHWRTFERLLARYEQLEQAYLKRLAQRFPEALDLIS